MLADTPTMNRAAGMPPVEYTFTPLEGGGTQIHGSYKILGRKLLRWDEHPFLWREPYGWSVYRDLHGGPFRRAVIGAEITRTDDGSDVLIYTELEPRNLVGRLMLRAGVGQRIADQLIKHVENFEQYVLGETATPFPALATQRQLPERARVIADGLIAEGAPASIVEHLHQQITEARDEEVARMRPFELADRWGEDRRATLAVFLQATVGGLLTMTWDVLCPGCRVGKREVTGLRELKAEAHCDACNIVFDASFDQLVEVRFSPAPAIRPVELREFCIGGPTNTPHVLAQSALGPGEHQEISCIVGSGVYRARAGRLSGMAAIDVTPEARGDGDGPQRVRLAITRDGITPRHVQAPPGEITLEVVNELETPSALALEDSRWPDTIATAAVVSTMPEFRDLFSSEVLAPGLQLGVSRLAFLFTDLTGSTALYQRVGQARAFRIVQDQFAILTEAITAHNGAIVKTIGDAVMATFTTGADALAAGLEIQRQIRNLELRGEADPSTLVRVGIHQGPCVAVTANERLDYFGTTVNIASRVEHEAHGGEVAVTADVCETPDAQALLGPENVRAEIGVARLKGIDEPVRLYRLTPVLAE